MVVQLFDPVTGYVTLYVNPAKNNIALTCTLVDGFVPQNVYGQYLYDFSCTVVWATSLFVGAPLIADVGDGVAFDPKFLAFGEYLA